MFLNRDSLTVPARALLSLLIFLMAWLPVGAAWAAPSGQVVVPPAATAQAEAGPPVMIKGRDGITYRVGPDPKYPNKRDKDYQAITQITVVYTPDIVN